MKRVYIAGPVSKGDLASNIQLASYAFERLALAGLSPFCPHWSCFAGHVHVTPGGRSVYALADPLPNALLHTDWMRIDLAWVSCADAVLRLPGESTGADQETAYAEMHGIPVFTDERALIEWAHGLGATAVS